MIKKKKVIKRASELMRNAQQRGEYNYGRNNKHGNVGEEKFAIVSGIFDSRGFAYKNPNPTATIDFPINVVRSSLLPKFLHYGHGIEFKMINEEKANSIKIGDPGLNADLIRTGGYVLGGFIWRGKPENIIDLKFWICNQNCIDDFSLTNCQRVRNLLFHKTSGSWTYTPQAFNAEVRAINKELRRSESSVMISSGLRNEYPNKRCAQVQTKKRFFDFAEELVLD